MLVVKETCLQGVVKMLVFVFGVVGLLPVVLSESCFHRRCLGCHPEETSTTGSTVECHPSNWVSPQWVMNYGHHPPSTDSKVPIEYRCLKMVATPDDKSLGNTVDVLRGCIPRVQVDSVCQGLVAVERARGHSDARCFICNHNNCNFATKLSLTIFVPILCIILQILR